MSKSDDFLKQHVAAANAQPKDATVTTTSNTVVDSANTFIEDVTADQPDVQSPRQRRLQRQAAGLDANDPLLAAKVQAAREQQDAQRAQQQQQESLTDVQSRVSRAVSTATESTGAVADRIASLPTVGGIGLLVGILVLLLFTVVRVNDAGDTRLKQLWYMLNGRATIKGRVTVQKQDPSSGNIILTPGGTLGGGSVGTFGGPDFVARDPTVDLGF